MVAAAEAVDHGDGACCCPVTRPVAWLADAGCFSLALLPIGECRSVTGVALRAARVQVSGQTALSPL